VWPADQGQREEEEEIARHGASNLAMLQAGGKA